MTVAFVAALVLLLASIAGLIHYARTPKDEVVHFGNSEPDASVAANGASKVKVPVSSS
jgi:hypothetical protein